MRSPNPGTAIANSRKIRNLLVLHFDVRKVGIMSPDIPFPSYLEQKRQLTQWKKENPDYQEVHSQVTQDVVKRLHNTWEVFKARGFGFPRYKKYGRYQSLKTAIVIATQAFGL